MKKIIAVILAVVLVVMLLASLIQIQNLQRKVSAMQTTISGLEDNIDRRMQGIEERVDNKINELLSEQQNVFHDVEFTYGEIHLDRKTVDVLITAVPKAYSEGTSEACATVNGQEVPLILQNGVFKCTVVLNLFEESLISDIRINNQGTVEIQELNRGMTPWYSVLLQANADYTGSETTEKEDGKLQWITNDLFTVNAYSERPFNIQSMVLVEELNGKEIGRVIADLSPEAQKEYAEHALRAGSNEVMAVPEQVAPLVDGSTPPDGKVTDETLCLYVPKSYELSAGDTLIRYLEIQDDLGFRYRRFLDCCVVNEYLKRESDAEYDLERQNEEKFFHVYDENGKLIR